MYLKMYLTKPMAIHGNAVKLRFSSRHLILRMSIWKQANIGDRCNQIMDFLPWVQTDFMAKSTLRHHDSNICRLSPYSYTSCKDILGSYTYVRLVSAQAHSFTRPHESEVNTSNGCGTHIQTYRHVSTCMQLYTYLVTPPESRMTPCYDE